jgi:hypothetical protein
LVTINNHSVFREAQELEQNPGNAQQYQSTAQPVDNDPEHARLVDTLDSLKTAMQAYEAKIIDKYCPIHYQPAINILPVSQSTHSPKLTGTKRSRSELELMP